MNQQTPIGNFHSKVIDFLEKLSNVYPDEKELQIYTEKYKFLKSANPRLTLDKFMSIIIPFETYIMNKDETFFLNYEANLLNDEYVRIINKIQQLWLTNMSDVTKQTVWKYFQVFLILGKKAL